MIKLVVAMLVISVISGRQLMHHVGTVTTSQDATASTSAATQPSEGNTVSALISGFERLLGIFRGKPKQE